MITATYNSSENYTELTDGRRTFQLDGKWIGLPTTDRGRRSIGKVLSRMASGETSGRIALPGETVRWVATLTLVFG